MIRTILPGVLAALVLVAPAVAQSAESCKLCHDAIYDEWKGSMHAKAWVDPIYQRFLTTRERQGLDTAACKPCHIPQPILLTGVGERPVAREDAHDEGVTCISCHKGKKGYHGPFEAKRDTDRLKFVHGSIEDARFRTHEICASCHGQKDVPYHDQTTSYLATPLRENGVTCQNCHMPYVERPAAKKSLYPSLPDRPGGSHLWPGSSQVEQIQQAFEFDGAVQEDRFLLSIKNNAGHSVPPTYGRVLLFDIDFMAGDRVLGSEAISLSMADDNQLVALEWNDFEFDAVAGTSRVRIRTRHRRMPFLEPEDVGETVLEIE